MRVNEYMSRPVTARTEDSYIQACSLMQQHAVNHIPVINDHDSVVGVLSCNDARLAASHFHTGPIDAGEVATSAPVMIDADAPLKLAAEAMMAHHADVLMVVDGADHLVGVLTSHDLHNALFDLLHDVGPTFKSVD